MSDHKFEKQVRQKLGDLKLTPTPESWEKIENEIRERKRRPAPIFWLPLLLLGLGAGGYFLLKPASTSTPLAQHQTNQKSAGVPANPAPGNTQQISPDTKKQDVPGNIAPNKPTNISRSNTTILTPNNRTRRVGNTIYLKDAKEIPHQVTTPAAAEKETPGQTGKEKNESINKRDVAASEEKTESETGPAKPQLQLTPAQQEKPPAQQTAAPKEDKKKKQKAKKWSFGVAASAGASAINEGSFTNFSSGQVEDVAVVANRNNFGNSAVLPDPLINYNPPPPPPPPSKLYPGFSFSAGVIAKRELSRRFSISAGLNYLQINTVTKVGYKVNDRQVVNSTYGFSTVDLYYLPTEDYINEYKNRYHLIEIPVMLNTRLNKSEKLPIHWNVGISAMTLLSSTALHYDGASGVYYKDDGLLNQVQGAITTGFSLSLFNKTSRPLWIGPTARYNISPVLKKDVSSNKNFMGVGLDVRWYLK